MKSGISATGGRAKSSPAFAGEGDHAQHGGGACGAGEPLHRTSCGPPPREIARRNWTLLPRRGEFEQPPALAVLEQIDRPAGPLLDLADALAHVPALGL